MTYGNTSNKTKITTKKHDPLLTCLPLPVTCLALPIVNSLLVNSVFMLKILKGLLPLELDDIIDNTQTLQLLD